MGESAHVIARRARDRRWRLRPRCPAGAKRRSTSCQPNRWLCLQTGNAIAQGTYLSPRVLKHAGGRGSPTAHSVKPGAITSTLFYPHSSSSCPMLCPHKMTKQPCQQQTFGPAATVTERPPTVANSGAALDVHLHQQCIVAKNVRKRLGQRIGKYKLPMSVILMPSYTY